MLSSSPIRTLWSSISTDGQCSQAVQSVTFIGSIDITSFHRTVHLKPYFKVKAMLTIGKVAKLTGFSASAIRYYERLGLLRSSRLPNGYRFYDEDVIKVLRFLRQAQTLGITLNEIAQLLELAHDGRRPCKAVRDLAHQHLVDIDSRIHQLQSLRNQLRDLLSRRVAARSDEVCPLISSAASKQLRPDPGDLH